MTYLGRYRLLNKLGEGAQGVVHRAEDPSDGSIVAIKILRTDRIGSHQVIRRFRKEARLMAEANNPYVVNLLEFNEDDGVPYMVLEFVAGESLAHLLAGQSRLGEREALSIMAAVARGLMQAHERGIVHRDIKPSNILLLEPHQPSATQKTEPDGFVSNGEHEPRLLSDFNATTLASMSKRDIDMEAARPRVKLSDFGLARHIVDSESMALTAAGAILGTPHYMAPEQWTGRAVDCRTDVYAMGATFFHLLAGIPPFVAETRDELAAKHCHEPPPRLGTLNVEVSDGVARLIDRALSKHAEDRYADAGAILRDLDALLDGRPTDLAIHPRLPEFDPKRVVQFEFRWELDSSPRQLWPLVTNTDRLDRAIGFAPVIYTTRYEEGRGAQDFIEGRKAGMVEVGEEHPYEWIEPRRMGVLREYSEGPFRWLVSVVELLHRPGGGTTLIHRLTLEPSSWKIRVGSHWGVGVTLRKSLARVYKRIDATVKSQRQRGISRADDAFAEPDGMPAPQRQRLERLLDRLIEQGADAEVVDRLGEYLALGPAQELARIRPLALAERWRLEPQKVVAACLWGAHAGLLELHWDLLCPVCRISCQVTDTLRAIAEHAHCEACNLDFQLDFARSIELIFRVHPEIRKADLGVYCVSGPAHSPHVLAQIRVAPLERIELELELAAGNYRVRGPQLPWSLDFRVQSTATIRRWDIDLAAAPTSGPVERSRWRADPCSQKPPSARAGGPRRADSDKRGRAHRRAGHVDGTVSRTLSWRDSRAWPARHGLDGDSHGHRAGSRASRDALPRPGGYGCVWRGPRAPTVSGRSHPRRGRRRGQDDGGRRGGFVCRCDQCGKDRARSASSTCEGRGNAPAATAGRGSSRHDGGRHSQRSTRLFRHHGPPDNPNSRRCARGRTRLDLRCRRRSRGRRPAGHSADRRRSRAIPSRRA